MKKSSRIDIEYQSHNMNGIQFGELDTGDVFRLVDEDWLYIVIYMPPGTLVLKQGVRLDNGGRRAFNENTIVVQVKMVASWVDM